MSNAKQPVLIIDNYDSFVYNLVQLAGALGANAIVKRNDSIGIREIERMNPAAVIISPGPCTPTEAGISLDVIRQFHGHIPMLGICLGHQAIGQAFGASIIRMNPPVHGKTAEIFHDGLAIYNGIETPCTATRYHSLIIDEATLPDCLTVTARTAEGLIMGVRHVRAPVEGLQFHPESILTPAGPAIVSNFLKMAEIL